MSEKILNIAAYGEIVWDQYPEKKHLGGAPFNVACRLHSFGAKVQMISALGNDTLGKEALEEIKSLGLDTSYIQRNDKPTGHVEVALNKKGAVTYTIPQPAAWDRIPWTEKNVQAVTEADALVIGSLAFRSGIDVPLDMDHLDVKYAPVPENIEAIEVLIARSKFTVFDVNLRAPYYDIEIIVGLMEASDMIKLNDEELELVVLAMGIEGETLADELKMLSAMTETPTICVTLGADGAMLYHKGGIHTQEGFSVEAIDTIGAGDSFLAALLFGLLSGETPDDALEVACAIGSIVASKEGANPEVKISEIDNTLGF
ncbi:PfkB family carbohydrate kinase [Dokdonia sp. Hel_I_53]|uniref:PfkB family carbohydrate kinase n=1 Tax=Dokdonia sp. Hel_I_53 TaxID=1566287 RepID=UPI00119C35FE|nr:PfkB family carbohydrate kinase [Dokdonia sp. Hel_I_53]TVZ52897.1 fructokinase [Dokdonia sp. Hel_I_53]